MKIIEDLLERLDNYFEEKKESEFYLIVLGIMAVVGLISYTYLIPITEAQLKKDLKQQKTLEKKIHEEKSYLASVTVNNDQRYKIKKLQKEIQNLQLKFNDLKEINEYSDYQIQTLSELLFNEKNIGLDRGFDNNGTVRMDGDFHCLSITEQKAVIDRLLPINN